MRRYTDTPWIIGPLEHCTLQGKLVRVGTRYADTFPKKKRGLRAVYRWKLWCLLCCKLEDIIEEGKKRNTRKDECASRAHIFSKS